MNFLVLTKHKLCGCVSLVVAFIVFIIAVDWTDTTGVYLGQSPRKLPIYSVETEEKVCALTFDACWGAESTDGILQTLLDYNAMATFFIVTIWAEDYEDKLLMLSESGAVEIGSHSTTHQDMTSLSQSNMELELDTSVSMLEYVTGQDVDLFRSPYGAYSDATIYAAEERGIYTIQWDVDSHDWMGKTAEEIATRVLDNVTNGSIILMHNDGENTLTALPLILDGLKNKGYTCKTVGDMIYRDNYEIDYTGRQIRSE